MNDLYWISVLGSLGNTVGILASACLIGGALFFIIWMIDKDVNGDKKDHFLSKTLCIVLMSISLLFAIANVFLPSKNDLYAIYGIGNTIDYLKDSKEAKKIPDKAIKALNIYLDNEMKKDTIK